MIYLHQLSSTATDLQGKPEKKQQGADLREIASSRCRAWRARAPKDELGDHPGLAVVYWITGNEPFKHHIGKNGKYDEGGGKKKDSRRQGWATAADRETGRKKEIA